MASDKEHVELFSYANPGDDGAFLHFAVQTLFSHVFHPGDRLCKLINPISNQLHLARPSSQSCHLQPFPDALEPA